MYWLDNNTGISTAPTPPAVISTTKRFFTNGGIGEQPSIPEDFWFNMIQEELLGVLTMAGITPAKNDLGQVAKAIQSIAFSAYPVGSPIPWPTAVPPTGFIAMIGQSFSATTYPKLALAYPSLVLPDMRAEFIRGWDAGRGIDSGRALLSSQLSRNAAHSHALNIGINSDGDRDRLGLLPQDVVAVKLGTPTTAYYQATTQILSSGSSESNPRNIVFNYIVRAA